MKIQDKLKNATWWKRVVLIWLLFTVFSVLMKYFLFRKEQPLGEMITSSLISGFIFSFLFNLFINFKTKA
jgi:hypothetical protein